MASRSPSFVFIRPRAFWRSFFARRPRGFSAPFSVAFALAAALGATGARASSAALPEAMVGAARAEALWEQLPNSLRQVCPVTPAAQLRAIEDPPISLDENHSMREIQRFKGPPETANRLLPNSTTLGFYAPRHQFQGSSTLLSRRSGNRFVVCVRSWDVLLTSTAKVFIGRELYPGTCARKDVVHHELVHYQIDRRGVAQLQAETPQIAAQFGAVYFGDTAEQAREAARSAAQQFTSLLARRQDEITRPRQAEHDSPEEYARTSRACGGAISRLVDDTMRSVR